MHCRRCAAAFFQNFIEEAAKFHFPSFSHKTILSPSFKSHRVGEEKAYLFKHGVWGGEVIWGFTAMGEVERNGEEDSE